MLVVALGACSHDGVTQPSKQTKPVPGHCERARGGNHWPVAGFASETPKQSQGIARLLVEGTRTTLAGLELASDVLRSQRECMLTSWEHFVVTKAEPADARKRIEMFAGTTLYGQASHIGESDLWEVYWGGASNRYPPHGATSAFANVRGDVLIIVQWLEG